MGEEQRAIPRPTPPTPHASRLSPLAPLLILLLAFALRVWQLDTTPPGWRDDELINSLVISQKVLDGDWAVYYADASGHEALYHALNAVMLGLFGPNFLGIRYLSALLSLLTIALTYRIGRCLFNPAVGLIAAAALTFSFWSLMYGRIGLRHVLTPPLAMLAFYFFWRALQKSRGAEGQGSRGELRFTQLSNYPMTNYLLVALFTSLGLYTYFASRGVPLILLAFCGYLAIFVRGAFQRHGRGWLVLFGTTAVLSLPLFLTLQQQPTAEGRVAELALPLIEARAGNFQPLWQYTITTLGMFHATGDSEWLYNIANRPLFAPITAIFFWGGVLICLWHTIQSLAPRPTPHAPRHAHVFLLLWWLAGISPAFVSIPPASLGHTILAQPATYLLLALPFSKLGSWLNRLEIWQQTGKALTPHASRLTTIALAALLLTATATRDLPDYFVEWPQRGLVRFLYRADFADIADYLDSHPELTDFGITSVLAGSWDKVALSIDVHTAVRPRWYNPERVLLVQPPVSFYSSLKINESFAGAYRPGDVRIGGYRLGDVQVTPKIDEPICYQNGLCLLAAEYAADTQELTLTWQVKRPLDLPPIPLISHPPPPGVYAGPRLAVFTQLLSDDGQFLIGDDGLWLDPTTLHEGDIFIQQHTLPPPATGQSMVVGLYDPMTNERVLSEDGRDAVIVEIGD